MDVPASSILMATAALVLARPVQARGECPATPRQVSVQDMTEQQLVAALGPGNPDRVTRAVAEIARRGEVMIPALVSLKGCRDTFFGGGLGHLMSAQVIPRERAGSLVPVPVEQAAIYLIVGIYRGSLAYAQSPYLVDLRLPPERRTSSVSRRLDKRAWNSVGRWVAKWRESGMEELRRRGEDPLAGAQVAFW